MADSSKRESKKADKKAKEQDDLLLSDSSQDDLECDICGVTFTDMKSYDIHLKGKKHQKEVSEAKLIVKHSLADNNEEDDSDEDTKEIHCDVCDKDISGYRPYLAHLKGGVHAKNVKKQKLKAQLKDRPEVLDRGDKDNESDDDEDDFLVKPYARCTICDKAFSGPENFNSHRKSAAHKKKVKSSKTLQNLKAEYDDGTKHSDDEEFFRKCDVCQKSFSGHIPYKIHMSSGAHKKRLEKKKVAEEIKQFCLNEETTDGYVCRECKKTFTDPLAFKSHLENNSHEKQKAKDHLKEFLSSHPEIVFVTPLDKADSDESDSEDPSSQYFLICKLCHMSFSGPESAQDHVKSIKHISNKKEKKMLKLLKEQQISSAVASSDKSRAAKDVKQPENGNVVNGRVKAPEKSDNQDDFEMI